VQCRASNELNVKNLNANSRSRRSKKKKLPEHLAKKWSQSGNIKLSFEKNINVPF